MSDIILQTVRVQVEARRADWIDTGLTVAPGETLRVVASGVVHDTADTLAMPEGEYADGQTRAVAAPEQTLDYNTTSRARARYPVTNTAPNSLALCVRASGVTPSAAPNSVSDALRPNRGADFLNLSGRVWALFNDENPSNNSGSFRVELSRLGPSPLIRPGQPSPVRFVPETLLAAKQATVQQTAWCWFVQPKHAPAEGYTSWDEPISCSAFVEDTGYDLQGNVLTSPTPALVYQPFAGVSLSNIPTSVKLGVDAPDVDVLNLDRIKLLSGFYEGAWVEVFEVEVQNPSARWVALSGTLGNAELEGPRATIELTPLEELTNVPVGRRIGVLCDVGRLPGETFGRGRCRNESLHDGPDAVDLTRGARIIAVSSRSKLQLAPQAVNGFAPYDSAFRGGFGALRFANGTNGGFNASITRDAGRFNAQTGELLLRRALPFTPAVGDLCEFEPGCERTLEACRAWNNVPNFRGFPFVPGRADVRQTYTT